MNLPETMRGLRLEEFNKPYVYHTDLPVPRPRPGEMILKVMAAGFCHTETVAMSGDYEGVILPVIPGHENVGVVAAVGEGVTEFKVGDRVGTTTFCFSCGACKCDDCQKGISNYCDSVQAAGFTVNGGMAEYMRCDPVWTVKLPDTMSFEKAAPLMCAGSTIYNSIYRAKQPKGAVIAIVGIGGLGQLGVQYAKALGYKVVAVDTRQSILDHIETLPIGLAPDLTINPRDGVQAALERISARFGAVRGLAAAIVATDPLPAYAFATNILAKHGVLVVVGLPKEPIPFRYSDIIFRDISITSGTPCPKPLLQEMVNLTIEAGIQVDVKVYEGLERVSDLIQDSHDPDIKGKLVVKVN
ncbi:unnamed protein product [Rhizoctonia solani]|uniref:Enoyl reductase (ER) domain-containing protein n=1 Tax=Rhizoctonia solani TaxID=456999 RepID=A0A8H3GKZ5_9AGAM|nr:unnamed protein product [Rhizoctonia solani]